MVKCNIKRGTTRVVNVVFQYLKDPSYFVEINLIMFIP